jgi:ABC-type Na+ transport system ATPase subunit NatA/biotin carboxyl carrier protein
VESPAILEDISLEVPAGKLVAIVGRSGSGKTTLARCLAGLLEPTDGTIRYDSVDLRTLSYRDLRRQIGFVLQTQPPLRRHHRREHRARRREPDMDHVLWAARVANADSFVERLPLAYETRVGESGSPLRRPAPAHRHRARGVPPPPVMILDEATSSLDTESERAIQENMQRLLEGTDGVRDRAPPQHGTQRGHDPGPGGRAHRGEGHERRADGAPGPLLLPVQPAAGDVVDDAPFLPTRPAPWAMRSLATMIMAVFAAAVVAALLIRVPETVESGFVLVPAEAAAPVRAPRSGTVSAVEAHAGDVVAAGAPLVVLRSEALGDRSSERASLLAQTDTEAQIARERGGPMGSQQRADAEEARRLEDRAATLDRMLVLRRQSEGVYKDVVAKYQELAKQRLVSETEVLAQQVAANQATVQVRELESERAQAQSALQKLIHERQARRLAHEEADRRLRESREKARIRIEALTAQAGEVGGNKLAVPSPCAGVVLRLSAEVPGAFVLGRRRRGRGRLLRPARCKPRWRWPPGEVGRLEAGQGVKLLYDAFPYQRYGVRGGRLAWVGPASVEGQGRTFFPRVSTSTTP